MQMKLGNLTKQQFQVLLCRGRGLSQKETAAELGTTRANVSMIELRAGRKIQRASETLRAFESTRTDHMVEVGKGLRIYEIPPVVLREGDKFGIHLQSNFVDIIRLVRSIEPTCLKEGRTTRALRFSFNQRGQLRLAGR